SLDLVSRLYRFRWQIELLFKEWKSYANLHKFDTGNEHIAAGLIWASLCAAVLKRFLAHAAQIVGGKPISTPPPAMCAGPHIHPPRCGVRGPLHRRVRCGRPRPGPPRCRLAGRVGLLARQRPTGAPPPPERGPTPPGPSRSVVWHRGDPLSAVPMERPITGSAK